MKSIIMIAYFFPPEGNAGSYRPLRFARALSSSGWQVRVISVKPYGYERYDPELLKAVPKEVEVMRVPERDWWQALQVWRRKRLKDFLLDASNEKKDHIHITHNSFVRSKIRHAIRKIECSFYIPDRARTWIVPACEATHQSYLSKKPDVIWATVGPISSGFVAYQVSCKTKVPYVLDFRDPWGLNYYHTDLIRPKFATRKVRNVMRQILEHAQSVVFLFETVAECYLRAYPGVIDKKKIHIIPNGFEGALESFQVSPRDKCTVVYAGTLSTYRYDTLLQGLQIFKQKYPHLANQLQCLFVGDGNESLERESMRLGLFDLINVKGPVSYQEAQYIQNDAHALLILGREPVIKGHELVAGAKLFGYLKASRPIIGVLPQDETRRILVNVGVKTIANVESPSEISTVFQQIVEAWKDGQLQTLIPDPTKCAFYSIDRQKEALVDALEGRPSQKGYIQGTANIPNSLREEILQ